MQLGAFQLLLAKQAQIDAGRAYLEIVKDYWLAYADLEGAVGGALPAATGRSATPDTVAHEGDHS